nr:DUF3772 domain-containing protein [uncultured Celeribacter sp.]
MIVRLLARLLLIFCLALPLAVSAQEVVTPDYKNWEKIAVQAEDQLAESDAPNATLESLRDNLAVWRSQFLEAENTNAARIDTLRAQIDALGPAPAEGETESKEIAQRRAELTKQLEDAEAPVKTAEEAYTRANGLIGEIDTILLDRQTDAFLQLGPSPLNPTLWPAAFTALKETAVKGWSAVVGNLKSQTGAATLKSNGIEILFYLAVAFILVLRGRVWSSGLTRSLRKHVSGVAGQGVTGFLASLLQVIVPFAGMVVFLEAAQVSGVLGPRAEVFVRTLPKIGFAYFTARWFADRLLYSSASGEALFEFSVARRLEVSSYATVAGLVVAAHSGLMELSQIDGYSESTLAVLSFPLIAVGAVAVFRLGQLIGQAVPQTAHPEEASEDAEEESSELGFARLVTRSLSRLILFVSAAAFVLGAAGYMSAAQGIVIPTVYSLAIIGLIAITSRFARDFYALLTRREDGGRDALVPVLVTFLLVVMSAPLFALVWGVREERLWEIWAKMQEGVTLGGIDVSVSNLIAFVVIFGIGLGLTRLLKAGLSSTILPRTRLDKGGQNAIVAGVGYLGVFLATIVAIVAAGIDLSALAIVAGALSVGIGFGMQNIVQNFASGIILLIERPISEGDWIDVGNGQMGIVRDISVRSTRVETFDKTDLIVPNADLISNQVTNYTRGNMIGRVIVPVGVAYGTDTRKVEEILREIAEAQPMVAMNPAPQVLFLNFGADSLEFEIRAILRNVNFILAVKNDINHAIAKRFTEEGIEIPFAQRDIWLRNPEALTGKPDKTISAAPESSDVGAATPTSRTSEEDARNMLQDGDMEDGGGDPDE